MGFGTNDCEQLGQPHQPTAATRRPERLTVVGDGSTFHHTRMKIALALWPDVKQYFGPDRRSAIITLGTHAVHWAVLVGVVPALDSGFGSDPLLAVGWPVLLALTVFTLFYGVYYNQFHEGTHNLSWNGEFGSRVIDVFCLGGMPFRSMSATCPQIKGHVRVHHASTFAPNDPDTTQDLYDREFVGVRALSGPESIYTLLAMSPLKRLGVQLVDATCVIALNTLELLTNSLRIINILWHGDAAVAEGMSKSCPKLKAWFCAALLAYHQLFFVATAYLAATMWPEKAVTAVVQVIAVQALTQWLQYVPFLGFTGGISFNAMDHLLVRGDQPASSVVSAPLFYLSLGFFYHLEHHDFARVPSWKLRHLRLRFPQLYDRTEEFGAMERVWMWFGHHWSREELAGIRAKVNLLRKKQFKMDLRIDESQLTSKQLDLAKGIAASMNTEHPRGMETAAAAGSS